MRQPYKCVCDSCKEEIQAANDENDIQLNMATYQFCPTCFDELLETIRDNFLNRKT